MPHVMNTTSSVAPLDVEVLRQFRQIFQSVRKHFQSVEAACGISGSQLWALARITETPGLRVTELAAAMAIHQSTASNLIEHLVRAGYVQRVRSATDQRAVLLHPTESGQQVFAKAPQPLRGVLPEALSRLSPEELRALNGQLARLITLLGSAVDQTAADMPLAEMTQLNDRVL